MIGGRIIGAVINGARNGFPVLRGIGDALFAPGRPARPATTEAEEAAPAVPKGILRSRTIWAVGFALACYVARQFGVGEAWVNAAIQIGEVAGLGAAAYYRVIATVPLRPVT